MFIAPGFLKRISPAFLCCAVLAPIALPVPALGVELPTSKALIKPPRVHFSPEQSSGLPVLYDQYNNFGLYVTSSQNFEPALDGYDDELTDDFVVPSGRCWLIQMIEVAGEYFNGDGPAASVNVRIYADADGVPGTLVFSKLNSAFIPGPQYGDLVINLSPGAQRGPGVYWLSIQVNMDYLGAKGQWGWYNRTATSNDAAEWRNPGGAFGTCVTWGARGADCTIEPQEPDQVFRLSGSSYARCRYVVHPANLRGVAGNEVVLGPIAPNPLNGATRIAYTIPATTPVRLSVYDVSGRMVDQLVHATQGAGPHMVLWEASEHPAGIYFLRLEAGGEVHTERATLTR